jgi:hypothetical protein
MRAIDRDRDVRAKKSRDHARRAREIPARVSLSAFVA